MRSEKLICLFMYSMAIVRDMTADGAALNKFCYAGLIIDQKNKTPATDDTAAKVIICLKVLYFCQFISSSRFLMFSFFQIIELVEQSKGWTAEGLTNTAENSMVGVSEEELYNMPTAEYVFRRGVFFNRQLTVYHVAFHACADLHNVAVGFGLCNCILV